MNDRILNSENNITITNHDEIMSHTVYMCFSQILFMVGI